MEDALTRDELDVLAVVLRVLELLDFAGARANEFGVGLVDRVRVLPDAEPESPYREQARPSRPLSLEQWREHREFADGAATDDAALQSLIDRVQRPDAQAIIFAIAYEAAEHCTLIPGETEFLTVLERKWNLSVQ